MKRLIKLRFEDLLNILFSFIFLSMVVLNYDEIKYAWLHLMVLFFIILLSFAASFLSTRGRFKIFYDWYFILVVPLMFLNLRDMVEAVNKVNFDLFLAYIDEYIFGVNPVLFVEKFYDPFVSEILQIMYVSYFFVPVALGIIIYKKDYMSFRKGISVVLLTFYLSYIGYFLVPAVGPRFAFREYFSKPIEGIFLTSKIKDILNFLEPTLYDCFPSGHTAVSVVCLMLSYKYKAGFKFFIIPVLGIVMATVYHRYHYVVDVIAGLLLAFFCFYIGDRMFDLWEKEKK